MSITQRYSYSEEDIEVKPSPELIADEYEHFKETVSGIEVHTFTQKPFEENVDLFCDTLESCGINVKVENRHSLSEDNCIEVLKEVNLGAEKNDIKGLIFLFCGISDSDGELNMFDGREVKLVNMESIWSKFYSRNCKGLKNKPKIFIFTVLPSKTVQYDSKRITFEMTYDTPSEADILTIYNKQDENEDFIDNFCRNIKEYGKHEDIISLATYVVSQYRPLVVSTLTRKFYFIANDMRGYHSIIQDNRCEVKKHLKEVQDILQINIANKDKQIKEKKSSFRFSFRLGKKKVKKEDPKEEPAKSTDDIQEEIQVDVAKSKQVSVSAPRRSIIRSRLSSTENESLQNINARRPSEKDRRPVWKP